MVNPADREYYSLIAAGLSSETPARATESGVSTETLLARLFSALVLLAALAGVLWVAADWEPRLLPIRSIAIDGELRGLSPELLQETLAGKLTGGILSQDLGAVRKQVEDLPWVRVASLRRVWPDRLVLEVSEHEAIAIWGEDGLVTREGHVFRPQDRRVPAGLPRLRGPDEDARVVVSRLLRWEPRLAELGQLVDSLTLDRRGDWELGLLGGPILRLGTEQLDERFNRLLAAYPLIAQVGAPESIDLRYGNGLAVRWTETTNIKEKPASKRVAIRKNEENNPGLELQATRG